MLFRKRPRPWVARGLAAVAVALGILSGAAGTPSAYAAVSDHTVQGVSPRGTTINLFDYWIDSQKASDQSNPTNYENLGINLNNVLKFGQGMGTTSASSTLTTTTVNHWTGSAQPRTGIVSSALGSDGYPTLSSALKGGSLAYLFNSESGTSKQAYTDVDGLLQVDENGYYYYNSQENFAEFNADGNGSGSFTLYDTWGVTHAGSSPDGQFFPFNTGSQVFSTTGSGESERLQQNGITSTNGSINHYFGLTMSTRFVQQYGGHTEDTSVNSEAREVTYNFSGDDDVWIYIDGVLVGDLGGIHDKTSIQINFYTGLVYVYNDANNNNAYDMGETVYNGNGSGQTLRQIFQAAGKDVSTFEGGTFADNTYHTLDFFYLERGNTDSNMSLRYNLVNIPESGVVKVDQSGNTLEGVTYELYPATVEADGTYTVNGSVYYIGTTDANGELVFTTTEGSGDGSPIPVTLEQLKEESTYWILHETDVPDGYRNPGDIWLRFEDGMLLSSNAWDTGTYAQPQVTVTASDMLYAMDSNGGQGDAVRTTDDGFIFAVVMQKQADGTWSPVYGDAYKGWTVQGDDSVSSAISAAQQNLYRFTVGSGGAFQVDIDNLPGDITTYEYVLANNGGNTSTAQYTIGYYYTTASDIGSATSDNTERLYVNKSSSYEGFDRVFSVTLNVSNIKNELSLVKTDADSGEPISNVEFNLYADADGDGQADESSTPLNTMTTDTDGSLQVTTDDNILAHGTYVLVETTPDGYLSETDPIQIVVDDEGVHVNAGEADDNVTVETGLGTLVYSMKGFAAGDKVDATLHDVVAQPQVASSYSGDSTQWLNVTDDGSAEIHLQYDDDNDRTLDYVLASNVEGNAEGATYTATAGWSRLNVTQCLKHASSENENIKQDLGDQSLNALFTDDVTIHVTNTQETTPVSLDYDALVNLAITKTLNGRDMTSGQFSFTVMPNNTDTVNAADAAAKLDIAESGTTVSAPAAGDGVTATVSLTKGKNIEFTQDDAGKTFSYAVVENAPESDGNGYTYDRDEYTVQIAVNNAGNGVLQVVTTVSNGESYTESQTVTSSSSVTVTMDIPFVNSYTATTEGGDTSGAATVTASKQLTGRDLNAGEFSFAVAPRTADGLLNPITTVTNGADGSVAFGSFGYTTAREGTDALTSLLQAVADGYAVKTVDENGNATWKLSYTAYELTGNLPAGVSANASSFDFTITVADNGDGTLTATANLPEGGIAFANTYSTGDTPVTIKPSGSKVLSGGAPSYIAGQFTFTLSAVTEDAPMPEDNTATNDACGNVAFDAIEFTLDDLADAETAADGSRTKTFEYRVTESGSLGYVTNDADTTKTFTVTLADDGNGHLTAATNPEQGALFTFTNTYEPTGESSLTGDGGLTVTKALSGRAMTAGEFEFTLTGTSDNAQGKTATGTNDAEGNVSLSSVSFDSAGVYTFQLAETNGGQTIDGVAYDNSVYTVTATVTDNGDGTLSVVWSTADAAGNATSAITFTNTYETTPVGPTDPTDPGTNPSDEDPDGAALTITKQLTGRDLNAGEFSFTLAAVEDYGDAVNPSSLTGTNDASGNVTFDGGFVFSEPGTYQFKLSEVAGDLDNVTYDTTAYQVTATVTDNGDGTLGVTWTTSDADGNQVSQVTFENTYEAPAEPEDPGTEEPENPSTDEPDNPDADNPGASTDDGNGSDSGNSGNADNAAGADGATSGTSDSLPTTGDHLPLVTSAIVAAAVILVAAGIVLRHRRQQR